jgi:hypothetical protein
MVVVGMTQKEQFQRMMEKFGLRGKAAEILCRIYFPN